MIRRPLSITVISWIFIAAGGIALVGSLRPLVDASAAQRLGGSQFELWVIPLIQMLSLISGVFMLSGVNWARWLLVVWVGYHVILSALHSLLEVSVHSLLFAVVLYFVFRPQASAYFRSRGAAADAAPGRH
jgi:hypothetical protein